MAPMETRTTLALVTLGNATLIEAAILFFAALPKVAKVRRVMMVLQRKIWILHISLNSNHNTSYSLQLTNLPNTGYGMAWLARDKHSSLLDSFISQQENDVLLTWPHSQHFIIFVTYIFALYANCQCYFIIDCKGLQGLARD